MQIIQKKTNIKNIIQNLRNKFLNQNYKLNIKFIGKKLFKQIITYFYFNRIFKNEIKINLKSLIFKNIKNLTSLFDKSLKKKVYKKNNIYKKKIKLFYILNLL